MGPCIAGGVYGATRKREWRCEAFRGLCTDRSSHFLPIPPAHRILHAPCLQASYAKAISTPHASFRWLCGGFLCPHVSPWHGCSRRCRCNAPNPAAASQSKEIRLKCRDPTGPRRYMVHTWALEGLLDHDFGAHVDSIMVLGPFGRAMKAVRNPSSPGLRALGEVSSFQVSHLSVLESTHALLTHVFTCMHACIHKYTHTYIQTYIHTCIPVCIYIYLYSCIVHYLYIYTYIYLFLYLFIF